MQSHSLYIQYPALTPSSASELFQRFRATSKFPSSHSLKIKAFLVAGDSWGLQQATAGLLLEENHEGRRRITGNHWQTCQPVGQWTGETPAQPCPAHSMPALSKAPASVLYPVTSIKFMSALLFLVSKDNLCWALNPMY